MTEYPHICITDPHSTIFELFDPTRIWLIQYSHGICHWKIEIYTMYSHIYLQFDHFWAYLTRLALDYFTICMVFAIEKLKFILHIRRSTRNLTIFETNRPDPHLTKWYLHWTVLDYLGIRSFTIKNVSYYLSLLKKSIRQRY